LESRDAENINQKGRNNAMPATSETTAYTKNPDLTEQVFADQIRDDIKDKYDTDEPTKKFIVKVVVKEVELD
jgi:hypothetical protein